MQYRLDRNGEQISALGYGCMRFSKSGNKIDFEKAEKEVMKGIELGINYFDTAYMYSGSEECLGKILEKNGVRSSVKIATKLPQYMMRKSESIEKTFQEELKRLRTDYVDYYLMHMFTDISEWDNLVSLGILDFIAAHKADGSIKNIGFSYHGSTDMFLKLLDVYDWDFCQIQYNYFDETSQAGKIGLKAAADKGLPVIIMEPLRGGKLVNVPEKAKALMGDKTPAEWALRWLWNQPEVTCVLSGMNSLEMVEENARVASDALVDLFTESDFEIIDSVRSIIRENEKVGCTGCRYCMPCPKGVDIPAAFHHYNLMGIEKKNSARMEYARNIGLLSTPAFASQCVECGICEKHCPQHIEIRKVLKEADKALRPMPYVVGTAVARKFLGR